jgi:hypothetical protein
MKASAQHFSNILASSYNASLNPELKATDPAINQISSE